MNNITLFPEPTLTTLIEAFRPSNFIAPEVLARIVSPTITGYFGRANASYLRIVDTVTKGNGQKNVVTYKLDRNKQYEVTDHDLENELTAGDAEKYGGWDAAKKTTNYMLGFQLMLSEESAVSTFLTTNTNYAGANTVALAGGDQWNIKTSEVLSKVKVAKDRVATTTGQEANTIILGRDVFSALQFHPEIYSTLGFANKGPFGLLSTEQMAVALGVDRVLVGRAIYNSAKEAQTAVASTIWGKNAIVAYVAMDGTEMFDPGLGGRVVCPAQMQEMAVGSYIPEGKEANKVQMLKQTRAYDNVIVNINAAYLITTAVA